MPIRPERRFFYPVDWAQLSAVIRFGRAKGCCEGCGRPHRRIVYHLGDGRWWDADPGRWWDGWGRRIRLEPCPIALQSCAALSLCRDALSCVEPVSTSSESAQGMNADILRLVRQTRVVLAAAHRDHNTATNADANLAAFCQRCHIIHERPEHQRRRWRALFRRKALGDLFGGSYA